MPPRQRTFVGMRLRRLREERGLTQAALARRLAISASYLNQIERDQRPLTVTVLLRIHEVLGADVDLLAHDDHARLVAGLHDALADPAVDEAVSASEIADLATGMPAVARALIAMHRRLASERVRVEELTAGISPGGGAAPRTATLAYEEVRDFFYDHRNHFPVLDETAERLAAEAGLEDGRPEAAVVRLLGERHDVRVAVSPAADMGAGEHRHFDRDSGVLRVAGELAPGRRAFQMATQLAFLEVGPLLDGLTADTPALATGEARALARIGLANYFAGALIMPYGRVLAAARELRYDIDLLGRRFGVGFESACHRLSTLQRPGARGVPFFFVRVDRAGNISKRQSATDFHFSRVGGSCRCGTCTRPSRRPGASCARWRRCPMAAPTCGSRAPSPTGWAASAPRTRRSPSGWGATSGTRAAWCTAGAWRWTTRRPRC